MSLAAIIPPGSVIGILGGGQLGRMTALAAAELGYRCHIYCPDRDSPAAEVSAASTVADYHDDAMLVDFAGAADVVTYEFENVPVAAAERLAALVPVRPTPRALAVAQDRVVEKSFIAEIGVDTAPFLPVANAVQLSTALEEIGSEAILKTARLGYDGKGQVVIGPDTDPEAAWRTLGVEHAILETRIAFEREVSVIVARTAEGKSLAFDVAENAHEGGILRTSRIPARITAAQAADAVSIASRIAEALDIVGLLAVEMFVAPGGRLLVNEIAPRPHNSGHWTIDACPTSQFEQLVRAICGLPLGSVGRHSDAVMTNLLGEEADDWLSALADPAARLHLYGKGEARAGRKMGHVTRLLPLGSNAE